MTQSTAALLAQSNAFDAKPLQTDSPAIWCFIVQSACLNLHPDLGPVHQSFYWHRNMCIAVGQQQHHLSIVQTIAQ